MAHLNHEECDVMTDQQCKFSVSFLSQTILERRLWHTDVKGQDRKKMGTTELHIFTADPASNRKMSWQLAHFRLK